MRADVDVRRVSRILRNLVTNAIDHAYADSHDPVIVRLASDEDAAAVTVRDFGVGLAPGESAMVFNRFWRSDPARARTSGGTGLGLAISLEDAHLHGGWLQAWGRAGRGAQFRLTLPRRVDVPLRHSPLALAPESDTFADDTALDVEVDLAATEATEHTDLDDPDGLDDVAGGVRTTDVTRGSAP